MPDYKILALMGQSGSGKDTVLQRIMALYPDYYNKIISCTTRPPREGEIDGINYYFLTEDEFFVSEICGNMLESTEFNGWHYGTAFSSLSLDKINIGVFNPAGIWALQDNPNIDLITWYLRTPAKQRLMRQLTREENPNVKEIVRRFSADEKDFEDLSYLKYKEIDNEDGINIDYIANLIHGQF